MTKKMFYATMGGLISLVALSLFILSLMAPPLEATPVDQYRKVGGSCYFANVAAGGDDVTVVPDPTNASYRFHLTDMVITAENTAVVSIHVEQLTGADDEIFRALATTTAPVFYAFQTPYVMPVGQGIEIDAVGTNAAFRVIMCGWYGSD